MLANAERNTEVRPYADAVGAGAIAFFGDKYGDEVRVVSFGDFSAELCGGTHVHGDRGDRACSGIVSEGSIGSGVRRIEAVTGDAAVAYTLDRDRLLSGLAARLRVSVDQLPERVEALTAGAGQRHARLGRPGRWPARDAAAPVGQRYVVASEPGHRAGRPGPPTAPAAERRA